MENSAVIQAGDIVVLPSCSAPGITIPVEESMEVMLVSRDELLARAFSDGSVYNLRLMDRNLYPIPIQRFNTWGYADENDMIIIPFDFDFAEPFYGDRAKVSITDLSFASS